MRITILGGAGGMGGWFARFFKENNCDVRIVDISDNTEAVAKQLCVQFSTADILKMEPEALKEAFVDTDVVLVSVPIAITGRVIERVGPALHEGSLLMDVTSVKKAPVAMMERCTKEGVEILGTHPLFGPSAKSLHGMPVIFVPIRKGPLYEKIYGMFERNGAKIEFLTAEEHDEIMAVIQGLPHFILFSYGITLKNLDFDVERARRFMGPMYAVVMDFVGRLLHQDPYLYAQIQTNFEMHTIHESFLAAATRLSELVSEGNVDAIMGELQMAKRHFGDTASAMRDSDRIIEDKINLSLKKKV
ncbi:MAG: prephenate dehydrogenase/arogenate dehydrogenase family protein [Methanosarcinales archaeon]|nr:prephenate dehydrogenase/arogenate dehydrogenase family protein [Methanosarcinales archaeon]